MSEENQEEYATLMEKILRRKKEKEAIPVGEDFVVVHPNLVTEDDRQALAAMKAVHEKYMAIMTREFDQEDFSFHVQPSVNAPQNLDVRQQVILIKCIWLNKLQYLISEVVGQQVFSALSDLSKKQILTCLWIFRVLCKNNLSKEAESLLEERGGGALLYSIHVTNVLLKQFKELNLNEEEMQIFSIYLIYLCSAKQYAVKDLGDFESHWKIVEKAVLNYEHDLIPSDSRRCDTIFEHLDKIYTVFAEGNFQKYLWTFFNDNEAPDDLEQSDYKLLYLVYFFT